jgi:hypothetical protein
VQRSQGIVAGGVFHLFGMFAHSFRVFFFVVQHARLKIFIMLLFGVVFLPFGELQRMSGRLKGEQKRKKKKKKRKMKEQNAQTTPHPQ